MRSRAIFARVSALCRARRWRRAPVATRVAAAENRESPSPALPADRVQDGTGACGFFRALMRERASLPEIRLEVLAAAEDTLDQHGIGRHHERYRRLPFKADGRRPAKRSSRAAPRSGNIAQPLRRRRQSG